MVEVPIPYSERFGRSKLNVVHDGMRFFNSIVWTALSYNPVRILGLIGLAGIGFAALVALILMMLRLSGVTQLGAWGIFFLFTAVVLGVTGVSLFSLGAMFNYLVSLFQKKVVQRGLFGKPIFNPPLDRQFWWMGLAAIALGTGITIVSLILALTGWSADRLWLWMLAGAMATLIGVQLVVAWIIMRVLDELSQREIRQTMDMQARR